MDTQHVMNLDQGFSVNGFIDVDLEGEVKSIQLSVRNGMTIEQAVKMTDVYIQSYLELRKKYPKPNGNAEPEVLKHVSQQEPRTETPSSNPDKPKRNYNDPIPQSELPVELAEATVEVFKADFDYFIVEPKPDSKASVKFFKDNLKFAVGGGINNWKNEQVSQFLAPLGDIDPAKADKIRTAGEVYWVKGAPYTKEDKTTGNYKDIKLVQAI